MVDVAKEAPMPTTRHDVDVPSEREHRRIIEQAEVARKEANLAIEEWRNFLDALRGTRRKSPESGKSLAWEDLLGPDQ